MKIKDKILFSLNALPPQRSIALKVVAIIAVAEFLIMVFFMLPIFDHANEYLFPVLDTLLLTIFTSPIIYTKIIKPYVVELEKRDKLLELERHNKSYIKSAGDIESLTAGLVHEIGNPIAIISGVIDEVELEYANIPSTVVDKIKTIKDYNTKLLLINNDLSKIAAPTSIEIHLVDFNEDIINKVVNILHYDERWYGVEIKLELSPELPAIYASSAQLKLLLLNLLNNCIEAKSNDKMCITMSSELINNEIVLLIKDNGKGMDENVQQRAFNNFYTTKDPSQHLGFGLYYCLSIAKENNARIELVSQKNVGTEVSIYFPIKSTL
jgi:two-component system, NtrC family, sensor kinase